MPSTTSSILAFLAARDFLLARREDYEAAYAGFRWPTLDTFMICSPSGFCFSSS